ncbi:hypothetical protein IQ273_25595 [Nodosilinea sp. LEGE 07298]|uniref:hypothetical protein n=1 Tax=Nodosilinea sp. LEGE 07298 TaxID=2777970 RepID=UPI0018809F9F|nr:hypothetical protein [Nodosilinea sp. LEGE 07298]MBE9112767.1 hypothetical protein [Nodosilinea sp. LEGE 07298]
MAKFGVKMTAAVTLGAIAMATTAAIAQAQSRVDWLHHGETITYDGYLLADEAVFASCDDDCADLDMFLYDAATGELVASDTLVDAVPVVVAPYEGDFLIEVVMASCSLEPCEAWTDSDAGF